MSFSSAGVLRAIRLMCPVDWAAWALRSSDLRLLMASAAMLVLGCT
jgi:hypothetical protein